MMFTVMTMQSVITYLLAVTLENQKTSISLMVDRFSEKISTTHHSHLAIIEQKIDQAVSSLKKISQEESQKTKSGNSSVSFIFVLYYQPLHRFDFQLNGLRIHYYLPSNDHFLSSLWVFQQPHPPKV